jgi:hypothetical protein
MTSSYIVIVCDFIEGEIMFKKSKQNEQLSLFTSSNVLLNNRALKYFNNNLEWHNQFRIQVVQRVDEEVFRPLFSDGVGAPNASVRTIFGMLSLKGAFGLSDAQLFENCQFNFLYRSALGLHNFDESIPVESTYYLFRKRLVDWEKETGEDLYEKAFKQITKSQIIEFNINGKNVRLDSSLLGSNISYTSRYELIHDTLRLAYESTPLLIENLLSETEVTLLKNISNESGNKVSYRSDQSDIRLFLAQFGCIIYKILNHFPEHSHKSIDILRTVFYQHYEINDGSVQVLPKEKVSANSIQSPHDEDSAFRNNGKGKVKGYTVNVTETCTESNKLNLITDVIVEPATTPDVNFLIPAIEATQELLFHEIESANADGAYHSPENQEFCEANNIDLIVTSLTGLLPSYILDYDENNNLTAICTKTNEPVPVIKVNTKKPGALPRWKIKKADGKTRYFNQIEIENSILRKKMSARTSGEFARRNNVEATIFQLFYHHPHRKSRYRGLIRHKLWANSRCVWINFVRILKYLRSLKPENRPNCPNLAQLCENMPRFKAFTSIFDKISLKKYLESIIVEIFATNRKNMLIHKLT